LAAGRKKEDMACFYEMKMMEEDKWKAKAAAEERKVQVEEKILELHVQSLALEVKETKKKMRLRSKVLHWRHRSKGINE
jgi:hypothetical protein